MKYIREIIIVVLSIIIMLMATCNSKNKPEVITTTKTIIDTVYFEQKERTVEVPVTKYVTVSKIDTVTIVTKNENYFKRYEQPYEDSLLKGTIINTVDGTLVSTQLNYVPKFPKYINETTTITNTSIDTVKTDRTVLSLGVGVDVPFTSTNFLVSLSHKRFIYQVGYNPFNRSTQISVNYKLWK